MKSKIIIWIMVIFAAAGIGYAFIFSKNSISLAQNPMTVPVNNTAAIVESTSILQYKDGTYSALGDYISPGGPEEIDVTVTLKKDIVTSAQVISDHHSGGTADRFQAIFIQNFQSQVIGRNISNVTLDRVSGSSLTPQGWNDAIVKIENQAQA